MSFIHLMLCNYYIISVMIMLYYVTILALVCPHLCYLMSFIHLMLCNYYIISVMIMVYYVTILEMQFIAIYDND